MAPFCLAMARVLLSGVATRLALPLASFPGSRAGPAGFREIPGFPGFPGFPGSRPGIPGSRPGNPGMTPGYPGVIPGPPRGQV